MGQCHHQLDSIDWLYVLWLLFQADHMWGRWLSLDLWSWIQTWMGTCLHQMPPEVMRWSLASMWASSWRRTTQMWAALLSAKRQVWYPYEEHICHSTHQASQCYWVKEHMGRDLEEVGMRPYCYEGCHDTLISCDGQWCWHKWHHTRNIELMSYFNRS